MHTREIKVFSIQSHNKCEVFFLIMQEVTCPFANKDKAILRAVSGNFRDILIKK